MKIKSALAIVLLTGGMVFSTPEIVRCHHEGGPGACDFDEISEHGCGWFEWTFCTSFCIVGIFDGIFG